MNRRILHGLGGVQPDGLRMADFMGVFSRMRYENKGEPSIHGVAPYSAQQILFDAVVMSSSKDDRAVQAYELQELMIPGYRNVQEAVKEFRTKVQKNKRDSVDILVYNLSIEQEVKIELGDPSELNLQHCKLAHEGKVPVGIGFSLPACDWVSQNGNFQELRRTALDAGRDPIVREALHNDGIELDDEPSRE
jgi:hypothetical protein